MGAGAPIKSQMPPPHLFWSYAASLSLSLLHPSPQFLSFMRLIALRRLSVHPFAGVSFLLGPTCQEGSLLRSCHMAQCSAALQGNVLNRRWFTHLAREERDCGSSKTLFRRPQTLPCNHCLVTAGGLHAVSARCCLTFSMVADGGMRDTLKRDFHVLGMEDL